MIGCIQGSGQIQRQALHCGLSFILDCITTGITSHDDDYIGWDRDKDCSILYSFFAPLSKMRFFVYDTIVNGIESGST